MMHVAHLTAHSFIGMGSHMAVYPPAPAAVMAPHVSMDTLLGLMISAKWSKTVIGPFGFQFIGQGSDSGFVVPHIAIPPPSVLVPVVIAFGGSKPMFSASTVHIDVDGSSLPMSAGMIPFNFVSINQACNDPCNYPSDMVISPNTVVVGLTLGDMIAGFVNIAIDCIVSAIANKIGGDVAEAVLSRLATRIAAASLREVTETLTRYFGQETAERLTRDAIGEIAEGIMNRPFTRMVQETVGKLIEGQVGNAVDAYSGALGMPEGESMGGLMGQAADISSSSNEPTAADSTNQAMTEPYPGAAPIHTAD